MKGSAKWRDFKVQPFDIRFPWPQIAAKIMSGKDPILDPSSDSSSAPDNAADNDLPRPRASTWLWRPWYAKLWWFGIVIYWVGKGASLYSMPLDEFYTSALAGFLNVAFFPPLALMVLGLGFARAWFDASDWEFVEPTHEQMFPRKSVSGLSDPSSDPLDPRSGMLHWRHFHPDR